MKISPSDAYIALIEYLSLLDPGLREPYLTFHQKHQALFLEMPASIGTHHSFPGGYAVHIAEVVSNSVKLAKSSLLPEGGRLNLQEVIVAAYVHDLDKLLMRYVRDGEGPTHPQLKKASFEGITIAPGETKASLSKKIDAVVNKQPIPADDELPKHKYNPDFLEVDDSAAVVFLCQQHGLGGMTWNIIHAVTFHHGGWAALARFNTKARPNPLAILLHAADQFSAGIQRGEQ